MLAAFLDIRPKPAAATTRRPVAPAPKAAPAPKRQAPRPACTVGAHHAKFEPLAPEPVPAPRPAEQPGRQTWHGLVDAEVKEDDELAEFRPGWEEDDSCVEEGFDDDVDDDVSEPDFDVDESLEMMESASADVASSLEDSAPPATLKAAFGSRRRVPPPRQKPVYTGPLLFCEAEDDDDE